MDALPPWEEIEHTADWAVRVRGSTLDALFENAAYAMAALLAGEAHQDGAPVWHNLSFGVENDESRLVDWLTELLYLVDEDGLVVEDVHFSHFEGGLAAAQVTGVGDGTFRKQIKAVTFHELAIVQSEQGYETTIIFDV